MKKRYLFAISLVVCGHSQAVADAANTTTTQTNLPPVAGLHVECEILHRFGNLEGHITPQLSGGAFGVQYSNWTPAIADFLKSAADSCANIALTQKERQWQQIAAKSPTHSIPTSLPQSMSYEITRAQDQEKRAIDEVLAANETRRAEKEKQQLNQQCLATQQSMLYRAQEQVIFDNESLASVKKSLAYEHRVADSTGVRNLYNERTYGEALLSVSDKLTQDFAEYKRVGGKASSPVGLKHEFLNPCANVSHQQ